MTSPKIATSTADINLYPGNVIIVKRTILRTCTSKTLNSRNLLFVIFM